MKVDDKLSLQYP